jgi:anhydro-N-acetylmuramic acid kinase
VINSLQRLWSQWPTRNSARVPRNGQMGCYIGLMSGTSTDGVDGVLVNFSRAQPVTLAFASAAFDPTLKAQLLALNTPSDNELHRCALAANALVRVYADVVRQLLQQSGVQARDVAAIGAHGQTVRHQPGAFDGCGYTWQLNQPSLLAELTGIRVIADFRSRDIAAGGQGAPLVPAFHDAWFGQTHHAVALLNIGGIANLTVLPPQRFTGPQRRPIVGFDSGPGNVLLDAWCLRHTGQPFDDQGQWAASGQVCQPLLAAMLAEPYFAKVYPKSTGRDLFNESWLQNHLAGYSNLAPKDVQATLMALTAESARQALVGVDMDWSQLLVCGGGALNTALMKAVAQALPHKEVVSTSAKGMDPMQVEATAFAWLARQHVLGLPANLPQVTGASGPRILGASYPP